MKEAWDGSERVASSFSVRKFLREMPHVCRAILFVTLGAFLVQLTLSYAAKALYEGRVLPALELVPADVFSSKFRLWQLVTYLFLHSLDNPLHILFNMLIFAVFAPEVERAMGAKRFTLLYFTCGIAAGLLQCAAGFAVLAPSQPTIGASGAVLGVLAVYASLFPKRVIYVFMVFPMKAKHCMFLLAGVEVFSAFVGNPGSSSIACFAHAGGFLAGFVFIRYEWTVRGILLRSIERHYDREFESDRAVRERVDELLDKVAREGAISLTWRERSFLKRASKRFKRQRSKA